MQGNRLIYFSSLPFYQDFFCVNTISLPSNIFFVNTSSVHSSLHISSNQETAIKNLQKMWLFLSFFLRKTHRMLNLNKRP
jgi:hypothetical protein